MKKVLQKDLDFKKWIESEKANRDLCSTYDFCKDCPAWSGRDCTRHPYEEGCLKDES